MREFIKRWKNISLQLSYNDRRRLIYDISAIIIFTAGLVILFITSWKIGLGVLWISIAFSLANVTVECSCPQKEENDFDRKPESI